MHAEPLAAADQKLLTLSTLIQMTAEQNGLSLEAFSKWCSTPITTVALDNGLLEALAVEKIIPDQRTGLFALRDENHDPVERWSFVLASARGEEPRWATDIKLAVHFEKDPANTGIVLTPITASTSSPPQNPDSHFRMFSAIVRHRPEEFPPVAHRIANSAGFVLVSWRSLGLAGLKSIRDLFDEKFGRNPRVARLAKHGEEFIPKPYEPHYVTMAEARFVPRHAQTELIQTWRAQLRNYRNGLVV